MAEEQQRQKKYSYALNSSLVLSGQNKDGGERRQKLEKNEDGTIKTGEGESLVGRKLQGFGDKVVKELPNENEILEQELQGENHKLKHKELFEQIPSQSQRNVDNINFAQIDAEQELIYRPRTKETQVFYGQIMHLVKRHLGDTNIEVLKDAIDEILAVLKDETLRDSQRKIEIDGLLGIEALSDDEFNTIQVLAQCLSDYDQSKQEALNDANQINNRQEQDQDIAIDLDQEDGGIVDQISDNLSDQQSDYLSNDKDYIQENQDLNENTPNFQNQQDNKSIKFQDINSHWLNRKLSQIFKNLIFEDLPQLEDDILFTLEKFCSVSDSLIQQRECEKELTIIIENAFKINNNEQIHQNQIIKNQSFISFLVKNRYIIYYGLIQSSDNKDEQFSQKLQDFFSTNEGKIIQQQLQNDKSDTQFLDQAQLIIDRNLYQFQDNQIQDKCQLEEINLENLRFQQGSRLMTNKKCNLPKGSTRVNKPGYEEIFVPALKKKPTNEKLVQISSLPDWAQMAFTKNTVQLNRIQSILYKAAFSSDQNLLICAPTGAGKTNIAMLACLQLLGEMKIANSEQCSFNLKQFKIIYIAPMKALVTEIVGNFQARLQNYGIKVKELTGDVHLTRQQIEESNLIVTTPEKWDIITRKNEQKEFIDLVKLIIIDEIHLLHDSRGPVLESIIARTIRQIEENQELVRIIGLSATLPNYQDVAALLRVDPKQGLFYFDSSYRPVPLEQIYIGISEKKAIKKLMLQNEICYEKVIERIGKHQIIIFVHSRKETSRTAKIIRDMAIAQDKLNLFVNEDSESKKILMEVIIQKNMAVSQDLKELAPYGIGIHHAGLSKDDRSLVEDLFASGHLQLLVSTATLAWGVNLPAHTVIIKGTQVYSPEEGKWVELSHQDILQMMGRAGRPQYDSQGEGIIITSHSNLQYYLSLNNMQLPIESQMIKSLSDNINAEIVIGTISNIKDAVNWLLYTYLYIRMRRNPELYGVQEQYKTSDPTLIQMRVNLAHSAALKLEKSGMIKYDQKSGSLYSTAIGKIASYYYIKAESMQIYNKEMKPHMTNIDLFRLFALSKEFQNIQIRENEKIELQKFIDKVPITVKSGIEEPITKINILLQAYIARFKLEGYDLNADMVYITQNASRIMRSLYEIALKKQWASLSENTLNLCKMIEQRQWYCATPLRQFISIHEKSDMVQDRQIAVDLQEIARRLEKKDQFKWQDLADFPFQRLGELIKYPKMGKVIEGYLHKFPRLEISAFAQPITRSTIKIEIELKVHKNFVWDTKFHGRAENFLVFVCDGDSEQILHSQLFILYQHQIQMVHHISFLVSLFDPLPPQYFIKVFSEKWLQADHVVPISFKNLIIPEKFAPPSKMLDIKRKNIKELQFQPAEVILNQLDNINDFSVIQSQVFDKLYKTDESVFIGVPLGGSESRIIAELSIFREIQKDNFNKIVYINPDYQQCLNFYEILNDRFGENNKDIGMNIQLLDNQLNGQNQLDFLKIEEADIIICNVQKWEILSRNWRKKKVFQQIQLYILDNAHMIQNFQPHQFVNKIQISSYYEVLISRLRMMQYELSEKKKEKIRMIFISSPISTSKDFCEWTGIDQQECCFNFIPNVRAHCPSIGPLQVNILAFDQIQKQARLRQMFKPIYNKLKSQLLKKYNDQAIIFVNDYLEVQRLALDLINNCICDSNSFQQNTNFKENISTIQNETLLEGLNYGIGWIYNSDPESQQKFINNAFQEYKIKVLICTFEDCFLLSNLSASLIIIENPESYCALEKKYLPLEISTILQMQSLAIQTHHENQSSLAQCLIMCHSSQKNYFSKLLSDQLPVESQLPQNLHNHLNSEIASGQIKSIQEAIDWITWSYLYRRIVRNPNYYEIAGKSGQHINDYLSELIEDTVAELAEVGCITVDENEMDLQINNLGMISSFYNLRFETLKAIASKITQYFDQKLINSLKMKQILEILCQAEEFDQIIQSIDFDEKILRQLALNLPYDINQDSDYSDSQIVTNILLQCHLGRKQIPIQYQQCQKLMIQQSVTILHGIIDIIQSLEANINEDLNQGSLKPIIFSMELCQMMVQGMWNWQSPLFQLPYLDKYIIEQLNEQAKVRDIADFMNMDDQQRIDILNFKQNQIVSLAQICNRYPNLEINIVNQDKIFLKFDPEDETCTLDINVILKREIDRESFETEKEYLEEIEMFKQPVSARNYPVSKYEIWWLIIGFPQANKILNIKKITALQEKPEAHQNFNIVINRNEAFKYSGSNTFIELKIYAVCDSYIGCDLEKKIKVQYQGI